MKNIHAQEKGFTLVETLVAVSILVLAVTGAFSAARSGLITSNGSKNQIIAFYLAQEGIEEIRNLRDQNGLSGAPWLDNIVAGGRCQLDGSTACMVDAPANTVTACSGDTDTCPFLSEDPVTGFYGYNSDWKPTIFKRAITMTRISADEVSILVTVSWARGTLTDTFRIRDNIMNWQSPS